MRRLIRVILLLALSATIIAPLSWAQVRIIPVPPHVKPQWTPVEGAPGVYYAPNLPTDLFRYRGKYYFYWGGYLYRGNKPKGPWKSVTKIPDFFYKIGPAYFKTGAPGQAPAAPTPAPAGPVPQPPIPEIPMPGTPKTTPAPSPPGAAPAPQPGAPSRGETVKPGI